jgi:hypothetical protein
MKTKEDVRESEILTINTNGEFTTYVQTSLTKASKSGVPKPVT